MIRQIWGYALLAGTRGRPPAAIGAPASALVAVAKLAWGNPERLESLDINPFVVLPKNQCALAVDALIVPRTTQTTRTL